MKIRNFILPLLIFAMLVSCGKQIPEESVPPDAKEQTEESLVVPDETEDTAAETEKTAETAETQTEPAEETEPEEITIVLGEETKEPEATDVSEKEGLLSSSEYADIYAVLKKADWRAFDDIAPVEEAEMLLEAVPEMMPSAPMMDTVAAADSGKVYTAEEMYSETNTQLADIDEGDIVKTDGKYIYILKDNRELLILSAAGEKTELLSRNVIVTEENTSESVKQGGRTYISTLYETVRELYISGNRIAVIRTADFTVGGDSTHVDIYDVSDPENPVFVTSHGQDGGYRTSRMKDDELWLITGYSIGSWQIAEPLDYESYIPGLFTKDVQELMEAEDILCPETVEKAYYTVVSSCDLGSGERKDSKAILGGDPAAVYMNSNHIYLAVFEDYHDISEPRSESVYQVTDHETGVRTRIIKLDITAGIETQAEGTVPGSLLNQFSMDEYNGYLRLVTSVDTRSYSIYNDEKMGFSNTTHSSRNRSNALYILNDTLEIAGSIENIAPDENVKSVRFTGNTGYFVTFRQVDPLFAVDLINPADPKMMSELKIPGFSEYLHPWCDGLLLGIGQDADEITGWTTGLKLSMFNVSDPYGVTEQHKMKLDFYSSEALNNHRAILVSYSRNMIGFPVENGYAVYSYDPDTGFHENAVISMDCRIDNRSRGLFAGDYVYIVMNKGCVVLEMEDFTVLKALEY